MHGRRGARSWWLLLAACLCVAAEAAPVAAQTRADSAAVVLDVARRLEAEGQRDAARAVYRLLLREYAGTPAALAAQALAGRSPAGEAFSDGRTELIVGGTLYGLWLGVALPLMFDADGPEAYGVGLLLGGPAGFLAARQFARARPVTDGQASAITFGGAWGTWQGFGWSRVLRLGREFEECPWDPSLDCGSGDDTQETVAAMVAGGLLGIGTGVYLARNPIRAGTATAASLGSMWGSGYGFAAGYLAGLDNDERAMWALGMVGGNVALLGTTLVGERMQISRERARLVSIAGVMGLLGGLGIDLLVQPENDKVAVLIPTVTSAAGLALGTLWTADRDAPVLAPGGGEGRGNGGGRIGGDNGDRRGVETDGGRSGNGGALLSVVDGRVGIAPPALRPVWLRDDATGARHAAAAIDLVRIRW